MFIPLFGGMLLGMFVEAGRSAYKLCIPLGIGAELFRWTMLSTPDAVLVPTDFFLSCLTGAALAMLSVFLIRWRMGRHD